MTNLLIHITFIALLVFTIFLAIVDYKKQRQIKQRPLITFLVPCYNCEKTIMDCIENIYASYENVEIIAINDCSKDNTLNMLKNISENYPTIIIDNKNNLGKTKSINSVWKKSKGELIWILDSDTHLTKEAVEESLKRLYFDDKIGAVSCRYEIIKEGWLSWMVALEFNMLALSQSAYNVSTALSVWGGCSVYKKRAFEELGGLKENMIIEDMDSALRLGEKGWRVEQCFSPVLTFAPETFKSWFNQKVRWAAGGMQCIFKHPMSFIKSPLAVLFILTYGFTFFSFFIGKSSLPFNNISILSSITLTILISMPYLLIEAKEYKDIKNFPYVILFVLLYYPIFAIVSVLGFFKGGYAYFAYKEGERGW